MDEKSPSTWTDEQMDQFLGNLLRWGVILSTVVVLAGGALYLAQHGAEKHDYAVFRGEPPDLRKPPAIAADAARFGSRGIIMLGVLVLMATPFARVACSLVAFALLRDRVYTFVTAVVLAVLTYSLFGRG